MDVLVEWEDGTVNVVGSQELLPVRKPRSKFKKGVKVKMYGGIWYFGRIIDTEDTTSASSSSDDEPLSKYRKPKDPYSISENEPESEYFTMEEEIEINTTEPNSTNQIQTHSGTDSDDSVNNPDYKEDKSISFLESWMPENNTSSIKTNNYDEYYTQTCEVVSCKADVFSSCFRCSILLCYEHFINDDSSCLNHKAQSIGDKLTTRPIILSNITIRKPECYEVKVKGTAREESRLVRKRENKSRLAKTQRNEGKEYTSPRTKKIVPARKIQERCNSTVCDSGGKKCSVFSHDDRESLFKSFHALSDLQLQREFVVRHCEKIEVKQRTTKTASRRSKTLQYFMFLKGNKVRVCKKFFLNTLSISEKFLRTSLLKIITTGTVQKDKRGGRCQSLAEKDIALRKAVELHINKFPKMESHYCQENSSRQYLHSELTLQKMYELYLMENVGQEAASLSTYSRVFKSLNLSFYNPKKDQCSLCLTYKRGNDETKSKLENKYEKHVDEKKKVSLCEGDTKIRSKQGFSET